MLLSGAHLAPTTQPAAISGSFSWCRPRHRRSRRDSAGCHFEQFKGHFEKITPSIEMPILDERHRLEFDYNYAAIMEGC